MFIGQMITEFVQYQWGLKVSSRYIANKVSIIDLDSANWLSHKHPIPHTLHVVSFDMILITLKQK